MYVAVGGVSTVAYKSIAQSKRWNRQPIPTGSSDYDKHVGGGVSLTATSDYDDKAQVSTSRYTTDNNDEKPATPPGHLRANSKSSRSNDQTDMSVGSTSNETSPSSIGSSDPKGSASQQGAVQSAQPNRGRGNNVAASMLMNIYLDNQKRTRSATASAQRLRLEDDTSDRRESGNCTAQSSPIKSVGRGHVLAVGMESHNDGDEQPRFDNKLAHHQSPLAAIYGSRTLPTMGDHSSPEKASQRPIGQTSRPNGIRYNGKAPVFKPMLNSNLVLQYNKQLEGTASNQNQAIVNNNTPAMLTGYPPQITVGGPAAVDTMQVATIPSNGIYQERESNGEFSTRYALSGPAFVNGANHQYLPDQQAVGPITNERVVHPYDHHHGFGYGPIGSQGQMQSGVNGNVAPQWDQRPPVGYLTPRNRFHPDQGQEFRGPYPLPSRWYGPIRTGSPNGPFNEGCVREIGPQPNGLPNGPFNEGCVREVGPQPNGYRHGLPGSASDGSMSRFRIDGQPNTSTAVARINHDPIGIYPTVGPMEFEIPAEEIRNRRSDMLRALTENGRPSLDDLSSPNVFPFTENFKHSHRPEEKGVVVLRNIPYETRRADVIALLGKSSKILNDREEPVHIIIDRVTGKTLDAYCELSSLGAAVEVVGRFNNKREPDNSSRTARIMNRVVEVEVSSQTNLMAALFPSSKCGVHWKGTLPEVVTGHEDSWENFKGFVSEEEMAMLRKHIESPQRSLYGRICPERPYECMISTLRKTPWYMAGWITLKQRQSIYECCMKMVGALAGRIEHLKGEEDSEAKRRLTPQLFDRLVTSAMLCPGFSVVQKHNIAILANLPEMKCREFNQPRFPGSWTHLWTLVPKAGMPIDVLEWYIAVIRAETNRVVQSLDISHRTSLQGRMERLDGYWGFFWAEANFPVGRVWDDMSLAECSRLELRAIDHIITRAVEGGNIPPSYTSRPHHIDQAAGAGPARLTNGGY